MLTSRNLPPPCKSSSATCLFVFEKVTFCAINHDGHLVGTEDCGDTAACEEDQNWYSTEDCTTWAALLARASLGSSVRPLLACIACSSQITELSRARTTVGLDRCNLEKEAINTTDTNAHDSVTLASNELCLPPD